MLKVNVILTFVTTLNQIRLFIKKINIRNIKKIYKQKIFFIDFKKLKLEL